MFRFRVTVWFGGWFGKITQKYIYNSYGELYNQEGNIYSVYITHENERLYNLFVELYN